MKFYLLCKYCGHQWEDYHYDESGLDTSRCPKCRDKNFRVIDKERKDVYGYEKNKK